MRHFNSKQDAIDFAIYECYQTLLDDYDNMCKRERQHYTDEDREIMKKKIHDINEAWKDIDSITFTEDYS